MKVSVGYWLKKLWDVLAVEFCIAVCLENKVIYVCFGKI